MKLMINHQTHYSYSDQACNSIQYIKMTPMSNVHQQVQCWDVSVPGQKEIKADAFNNIWITSSQRQPYQQMTIMAQGIIEINPHTQLGIDIPVNPNLFLQPTANTLCNAEMKDFAKRHVPYLTREHLIHYLQQFYSIFLTCLIRPQCKPLRLMPFNIGRGCVKIIAMSLSPCVSIWVYPHVMYRGIYL